MSEENNTVRAKPTRGARPTGPRAHRIRRIVLGVAGLVALALLVSAIGYMWWFSALVDELADGENLEDYGEWLRGLQAKLYDFIKENDGYIPGDPYAALVQSGKVQAFYEFVDPWADEAAVVIFDHRHLPARIHTDLKRNAPLILFWFACPDSPWRYVCYADGRMERWGECDKVIMYPDGRWERVRGWKPPPYLMAETSEALTRAGYPKGLYSPFTWAAYGEKKQWLQRNKDRLVWDDALRMYVVE